MELDTIIHGDCTDILRHIPADSIDMIFADPPYGNGNYNNDLMAKRRRIIGTKPGTQIANDDRDSARAVTDNMLYHAARLLKRNGCICCCSSGGGPSPTFAWLAQRLDSSGLTFANCVIWDKVNPGLGWKYRRQYEMIMVAHRKGGRLRWPVEKVKQRNIISMPAVAPQKRHHPNEKPLELVKLFISLHTKPGDTVLDPFAGCCTTAIACIELDRRYICIELDKKYIDAAKERIKAAKTRIRLQI